MRRSLPKTRSAFLNLVLEHTVCLDWVISLLYVDTLSQNNPSTPLEISSHLQEIAENSKTLLSSHFSRHPFRSTLQC